MAKLFDSYTFNNGIEVKNRLVVAPMTHFGSSFYGALTDEERNFLQGRAENFGMFITAATLVTEEGKAFKGQPEAMGDEDLPSLTEVAEIIHKQGARAILQIHHGGRLALKELIGEKDIIAPSVDEETGAREATEAEIEAIIKGFGKATELAIKAGFDGVEIHGANNYLIQQFTSGETNKRTDKWGGSREKRLTFPAVVTDTVLAVREQLHKPEFIVGYRFSPEEPGEHGLTMEDTFALIDVLLEKDLQYLHVSLHQFGAKARRGADTNITRVHLLHEHIDGLLPLIGVGTLLTGEQVEAAIATNDVEFVGLGKSVLMNPNMATLLKNHDYEAIETEIDPAQKEKYRYPDMLWALNMRGRSDFLPPVKGRK